MNLKKLLKQIKLNEESISMVLGALVIVIVGILIVNYFQDKRGETTPVALTTTNQIQIGKTHTVLKGETLWGIAEEAYGSGYNWMDIYTANDLIKEKVEIGQTLEIPEVVAKQPTVSKTTAVVIKPTATMTANSGSQTINGDSYTVVHGDSLWSISVRAYGDGYQWSKVAQANKLVNPNKIHVGNVLVLPR